MDRIFFEGTIKVYEKLEKRLESLHTMIFSNATYLLKPAKTKIPHHPHFV